MKKIILLLFFIPSSQFLIAQEELEEEKTLSLKASRSFNIKTELSMETKRAQQKYTRCWERVNLIFEVR